jgi:hypothetical protein
VAQPTRLLGTAAHHVVDDVFCGSLQRLI